MRSSAICNGIAADIVVGARVLRRPLLTSLDRSHQSHCAMLSQVALNVS